MFQRLVDLGPAAIDLLLRDANTLGLAVVDVLAGSLGRQAALGKRTRGKRMGCAADGVARAEQALDRGHAVVAPEIFGRRHVFRAGAPGAAAGRMRTHDVGLGGRQFRVFVLRIDIRCRPQYGLANGHAEEVVPADLLEMRILEGFHGHHVDGSAPRIDLVDQRMVTQTGRDRAVRQMRSFRIQVLLAHHFLQFGEPLRLVLFAVRVLRVCLQVQEVRANRAVAVLESSQHDPVFHLGHFRAGLDQQPIGRARRPGGVPDAARTFTDRARAEDVGGATGADDNGLGFEYVVVAGTHVEADGAGDTVLLGVVHQQVRDADAVEDLVRRLFRRFGDDRLVGFAVDHDLPAALTLVSAGLGITHDRQTPFLELVHRRIDVTRHVEQEVFAHHAHQVDSRIANVVFRVVLAEAGSHVAVDRVQTLRHGAGTVYVRFFSDDDLLVLTPVARFESSAGTAEAGTRDQDVDVVFYDRFVGH